MKLAMSGCAFRWRLVVVVLWAMPLWACDAAPPAERDDATTADGASEVVPEVEAPPEVAAPSGLSLQIDEGDEVVVQTPVTVRVVADEGVVPPERVSWRVTMPLSPEPIVLPETTRGIHYELNCVGDYTFMAEVHDAAGVVRTTLTRTVTAVVPARLHVELTWVTPGDPDPFDVNTPTDVRSVGSDLDLHFVRGDAGYFGTDDVYFANVQSSWGIEAHDPPRLDRDDTDGMGPENLNLSSFEPGVIYRVGVHYRDDAGFGESFARVRIFVDGVMVDDWGDVRLVEGDMWSSHHIMDGRIVRLGDGSPLVSQFDF